MKIGALEISVFIFVLKLNIMYYNNLAFYSDNMQQLPFQIEDSKEQLYQI